jgi:hypothetical protein
VFLSSAAPDLLSDEEEFLWRGADTTTLGNGTVAPRRVEF